MKIGFDISALSLPRSGVGQYQVNLLKALLSADKENEYLLYGFNFRNRERFKQLRFGAVRFELKISPVPQRLITGWWLSFPFPSLERVVGECDLYHVSELAIPPVKKAKRVAFVHDLTTFLYPQYHVRSNRFLHNRRFKHLNSVDAILTNSEYTKKDITEHLGINPEKIHVTYLGADSAFRPMPKQEMKHLLEPFKLNKPYILFVGTLEPRKNIKNLIRAFNRLKLKRKIPHQLVLAGQDGWLCDEIYQEINNSPARADILRLGYVSDEDVPKLMNGADCFVYPSYYEGFGLPVLEAMQCGTPVITSNRSSLPEVGGEACFYIEPESIESISEALYKVLSQDSLRKTMRVSGIEQAKLFSWEKCAEVTLSVYKSILSGK